MTEYMPRLDTGSRLVLEVRHSGLVCAWKWCRSVAFYLLAAVGELKPYGRKVGTGGRSISAGDGHKMSWHSSKRMALNAVP